MIILIINLKLVNLDQSYLFTLLSNLFLFLMKMIHIL